jgi:spore maturation protein CgeB
MNTGLHIAIFGSSLVSSYWNGAATYYRGLARALAQRGHRVSFFEPDAYQRQQHRDIPDPAWAEVIVYQATEAGVEQALEGAADADVLVKASGVGVFDEFLEREVLELPFRSQRMVVFWDVDAPATLERAQNDPDDPFRELIPRYDLILTYGGGEPVIRAYRQLGAADCVPIYNALDPETHFPAAPDRRFEGLVGFLGNRMPDRERRVHEFFFQPASRMPDDFVLGGSGWDQDVPELPNVRYVGHVGTQDHNVFNSSPTAVLNINRDSMARFGFSPPTRVFEAAGAGACLISDVWTGIELFLEPDRDVLVANDASEVVEHLRRLTPERAKRIGERARQRVLSDHTYRRRAEQVEAVLTGAAIQIGNQ